MRVPTSTYRLQLRAAFGFERAAEIVPYLAALGAGDVYASPILAATRGSPHGYDGTDPGRLDDERGGEATDSATSRTGRAAGRRAGRHS